MSGIHELFEVAAMRSQRANPQGIFIHYGELKSYRASDNTVDEIGRASCRERVCCKV